MRPPLALAALLALLPSGASAQETPFPIPCAELNQLWLGTRGTTYAPRGYQRALRTDWGRQALRCDLIDGRNFDALSPSEMADITMARAAYVLDTNKWARSSRPFDTPIVGDGIVSGPPESMFNWIKININGVVYGGRASGAEFRYSDRKIYLAPDNFSKDAIRRGTDGVSMALQLSHEAQHSQGNHIQCWNEQPSDGLNCDQSVMEQFPRIGSRPDGGSHGMGVWYATWIANYSDWPSSYRVLAQNVALMVLGCSPKYGCMNRINDRVAAERFSCRYFSVKLDGKSACRSR